MFHFIYFGLGGEACRLRVTYQRPGTYPRALSVETCFGADTKGQILALAMMNNVFFVCSNVIVNVKFHQSDTFLVQMSVNTIIYTLLYNNINFCC